MAGNPLTSQDLYQDGGHLKVLTQQLGTINSELETIVKKAGAFDVKLKSLTFTKSQDQKELSKMAIELEKLNILQAKYSTEKAKTEAAIVSTKLKEEQLAKTRQQTEVVTNKLVATEATRAKEAEKAAAKAVKDEERRQAAAAKGAEAVAALAAKEAAAKEKAAAKAEAAFRKANPEIALQEKLARSATSSFDALSAQYSINKIKLNAMTQAQRESTTEGRKLVKETRAIYEEMKRLQAQTGMNQLNVGNYNSALKGLWTTLKQLAAAYIGITAAQRALDTIFTQTRALDSLDKALKTTTGSEAAAADAKAFLSDMTERLGISLVDTTKSYLKFSIASKSAGFTVKQSQDIFESFGKAGATLGLRADELDGIFKALEQIMSKGTVQAEELRGQLGDRLPGAFTIMAESMGVSTAELGKMLKAGKVLAADVLPNFAKQVEIAYGIDKTNKVNNLAAAQGRFNREVTLLIKDLDASGTFKAFFDTLTGIFTVIRENLSLIFNLGKAVLYIAAAYTAWKLSMVATNALQAIGGALAIKDITLKGLQSAAAYGLARAQQALNAAMKANPIGLILTAAIALVGVFDLLSKKVSETQRLQKALSSATAQASAEVEFQKLSINRLISSYKENEKQLLSLKKGTEEYNRVSYDQKAILTELNRLGVTTIDINGDKVISNDELTASAERYLEVLKSQIKEERLLGQLREATNELTVLEADLKSRSGAAGIGEFASSIVDSALGTDFSNAGKKKKVAEIKAFINDIDKQIKDDFSARKKLENSPIGFDDSTKPKAPDYKSLLSAFEKERELISVMEEGRAKDLAELDLWFREKSDKWKKNGLDIIALEAEFKRRLKKINDDTFQDGRITPKLKSLPIGKGVSVLPETLQAEFDAEQAHAEKVFALQKHTELEIQRFKIQAEIDRLQFILKLNSDNGKELTDIERKRYQELLSLNQAQLGELNTKAPDGPQDLFDLLGFKNFDDKEKQAITDSLEFAKDQLRSYFDTIKELRQQNVDDANAKVAEAQRSLQYEMDSRAQGYADRVEYAQKELSLAKKQQQEALKERQKTAKQEIAINAAMEASSLALAIANTLKAGGAFAIPLVAVMLTAFAIAKAKAFALASKKTFGKGGIIDVKGGSHASGNDTPLGVDVGGRPAYAEGGEKMAIFSKKASRRYPSELTKIVNAANAGKLHEILTLTGRASDGIAPVVFNAPGTDTRGMERRLDRMIRQGESFRQINPDGSVTIYSGNNKTTIRR